MKKQQGNRLGTVSPRAIHNEETAEPAKSKGIKPTYVRTELKNGKKDQIRMWDKQNTAQTSFVTLRKHYKGVHLINKYALPIRFPSAKQTGIILPKKNARLRNPLGV